MTEMSALLGRVQLSHIDSYLQDRRRVKKIYMARLGEDPRISLVLPDDDSASTYWKVPLLLAPALDRCRITQFLKGRGVNVDWMYHPPLHCHPYFSASIPPYDRQLPVTDDLLSRHLCLPCHPRISDDDAHYVAETLFQALDEVAKS